MTYKDDILNERGKTHGNFVDNANLSQELKRAIHHCSTAKLSKDKQEALEMICLKISRICTGNPNEKDHWLDISGYAKLIYEELNNDDIKVGGYAGEKGVMMDDVTIRTGERLELRRAQVASYKGPDKVSFTDGSRYGSRLGMVIADGPGPQAIDGETGEPVTFSIS